MGSIVFRWLLCLVVLRWLLCLEGQVVTMEPPPVEASAKKARKVWQAANPMFQPYVSGHSTMAFLPLKGFWLRSGAGQAVLEVVGDTSGERVAGSVQFKEAPLHLSLIHI